jgi:protein-S-isoprenylcysteine O-methyltransferase Ste14
MSTKGDRAAIIAPPPLFALICIGLAFLAWHYKPLPLFASRSWLQIVLGAVVVIISIAMVASARRMFVAHGTYLNPYKPTQAIVTTGLYRFSRNPIYIAFVVFTLSFTFFANDLWFVIFAVVLFFPLHFGVVKREEVYLEAKFGDSYRDYCRKVRRWL